MDDQHQRQPERVDRGEGRRDVERSRAIVLRRAGQALRGEQREQGIDRQQVVRPRQAGEHEQGPERPRPQRDAPPTRVGSPPPRPGRRDQEDRPGQEVDQGPRHSLHPGQEAAPKEPDAVVVNEHVGLELSVRPDVVRDDPRQRGEGQDQQAQGRAQAGEPPPALGAEHRDRGRGEGRVARRALRPDRERHADVEADERTAGPAGRGRAEKPVQGPRQAGGEHHVGDREMAEHEERGGRRRDQAREQPGAAAPEPRPDREHRADGRQRAQHGRERRAQLAHAPAGSDTSAIVQKYSCGLLR